MDDEEITRILLIEAHAAIASTARGAVSQIGVPLRPTPGAGDTSGLDGEASRTVTALSRPVSKMSLTYPPENEILTEGEERALADMKLDSVQRDALEKLVADACHATLFRFMCLMDSVGDPDVVPCREWLGARFTGRVEGEMLHDLLGDAYWEYKEAVTAKAGA